MDLVASRTQTIPRIVQKITDTIKIDVLLSQPPGDLELPEACDDLPSPLRLLLKAFWYIIFRQNLNFKATQQNYTPTPPQNTQFKSCCLIWISMTTKTDTSFSLTTRVFYRKGKGKKFKIFTVQKFNFLASFLF